MLPRLACLLLAASATALKLPGAAHAGRRAALTSGGAALVSTILAPKAAQAAVSACPGGANNCYSTVSTGKNKMPMWTWPSGEDKASALKTLQSVVEAYPQQGQGGVDLGGWSVAEGDFASGNVRLEFKSGVGNMAKFFNGGKPFVDDLSFSAEASGVAVKSSSRVGDSDFGVNGKRLNYIAQALQAKGWEAPTVKALR